MWIKDNLCRNLSRAITLFGLNETEFQRYIITFNHNRHSKNEKRCKNIVLQLDRNQDISATIDVNNCGDQIRSIEGYFDAKALELVSSQSLDSKYCIICAVLYIGVQAS